MSRSRKSKIWSTWILLAILVLIAIPTGRKYLERRALQAELALADEKISQYEASNRDLSRVVEYLQTPQAKEDLARQELGMRKDTEQVVVIKGEEKAKDLAEEKTFSNPQKWFNYFFR